MFGSPGMLWWGAAAAVPIIIHLLSRRRFKRVPWAAMDFLQRAFKKTRKRLRIENLLLMLLRAAALVFIALALSDPRSASGGLFSGDGSGRNAVILVDTSFSMGLRDNRDYAAFDRARTRALELVEGLDPETDTAALVVYGNPARLVVPMSREIDSLRAAIENLEPGDVGTDLLGGLKIANGLVQELSLKEAGSGADLWVFGDMQREAFLAEVAPEDGAETGIEVPDALFEKTFRDLRDAGGEVYLVDLGDGEERPDNVAVVDISHRGKALVRGISTSFEVRVRNFGSGTASGELQFFVDNEEVFVRRERMPDLKGMENGTESETEAALVFDAVFDRPGWHHVAARWVDDGLKTDNIRRFAFEVRDRIRVLLVDGSGAREIDETSTFFLARALDPTLGTGQGSAFQVKEISTLDLRNEKFEDWDIVALCDVPTLEPARLESLKRWVEGGGSLLYFAGPGLEAPGRIGTQGTSNALFHDDGRGLLPVEFESSEGGDEFIDRPYQLQFETFEHPVTAYFEDPKIRPGITRMPVWRFIAARPDADARVLASFRQAADRPGAQPRTWPALVEADRGQGRVIVFTSSANRAWNLYGATPAFVPLSRELGYHLASRGRRDNVLVGDSATMRFPAAIESVRKDDGIGAPVSLKTSVEEGRAMLVLPRLEKAGLVRLEPVTTDEEIPSQLVAVNVDPRESDLLRAGRGWLVANFGSELFQLLDGDAELARAPGRAAESNLWRLCLWIVLLVMAAESVLALLFGRRERVEAAA